MATKSDFSTPEWEVIKDSPYWVQAAINAAEGRMGLMERRREAAALKEFMETYKSSDPLVKAIMAEGTEVPKLEGAKKLEDIGNKLREIADIVDAKSDDEDYDAFTNFLLDGGSAIAGAVTEGMMNRRGKDAVSDQEAEALDIAATALKATDADKHARAAKAAAARRAELEKKKKEAAAAKAKKEKEAEMKKQLEEAEKKVKQAEERERKRKAAAEKQAKLRAERQKRLREERKKKAAEAKAAAAAKAAEAGEAAGGGGTLSAEAEGAPVQAADGSRVYTVQAGDSLWAISAELLGAGNRYMEIFNMNTDKLKDPGMIFPGQELKIPAK
ncbi:MAG: LysM peptidoglycan-binding domain-containing protein [Chloroflexota bacterium]